MANPYAALGLTLPIVGLVIGVAKSCLEAVAVKRVGVGVYPLPPLHRGKVVYLYVFK